MQVLFMIAWLVTSLVQLFAIMDALALHTDRFLAAIIALLVNLIPFIGPILGIDGAVKVWDLSLLQAATLFFWYYPVVLVILSVDGAAELMDRS
jgi:hypothetical protein